MQQIIDNINKVYELRLRSVKLIGIVYDPNDKYTDFRTYLSSNNTLIIYNENFNQYYSDSCSPGGGNGFMRQYRSDANCTKINALSLGIPTGCIGQINDDINSYHNPIMKITYKQLIDQSIENIVNLVLRENILYILWAIDTNGSIGISIFKSCPDIDNISNYITQKMKDIFKNINYYSKQNVTNHGSYFDIKQI